MRPAFLAQHGVRLKTSNNYPTSCRCCRKKIGAFQGHKWWLGADHVVACMSCDTEASGCLLQILVGENATD